MWRLIIILALLVMVAPVTAQDDCADIITGANNEMREFLLSIDSSASAAEVTKAVFELEDMQYDLLLDAPECYDQLAIYLPIAHIITTRLTLALYLEAGYINQRTFDSRLDAYESRQNELTELFIEQLQ